MEYIVIRSGRKTLSLSVDKDGMLIVRAPYALSEKRIEEFISEKSDWIAAHSADAQMRTKERKERLSTAPEALPLFGELRPVSHEKPYGFINGQVHIPENMTLEELLPYLRKLYSRIGKEYLIPMAIKRSEETGLKITSVKVNSAGTRWGSCSARKSVNLSWKLIAAAPELIDYVIIHELCHTVYMDHSKAFWALVEKYIPDHKQRREALANVQKTLSEYGLE